MDLSCIATDHPEMKMMSLDAHTWMVRCRWTRSPPQCCRKISRSRPAVENRETINPRAHGRPPHDIQHREFTSGKSRRDTLAGMGIEAVVVPQSNVLDGINIVRRMLGRTWIDSDRCERGIEALRQYRREWNDNLKDWSKAPLHDFSSHGADALRTFACGFDDSPVGSNDPRGRGRQGEPPPRGTFWSA